MQPKKTLKSKNSISNINKDINLYKGKVLSEQDLNSILFQLKRYYNELTSMKSKGEEKLKNLEEQNNNLENKIKELEDLKDIPLAESNKIISIKDQGASVETKEEIEKKVMGLLNKKTELENKLISEEEYSNTLTHLINCEKSKLDEMNKQIIEYEDKCTTLNLTKKSLQQNEKEILKKEQNYSQLNSLLDNETIKISSIVKKQKSEILKINNELNKNSELLKQRKQEVEELEIRKKEELESKKQELINKIKETYSKKEQTSVQENYYIKLILGLYILQKYFLKFINKDMSLEIFDEKELIESREYKQFTCEKYSFNLSKRNTLSVDSNKISKFNVFQSSEVKERKEKEKDVYSYIEINELKTIVEQLDFDFSKISDFYSKLNTQISHYHNTMMIFNMKQINLESKKDLYTKKVKEILKNNYQNFDDLIKNNSKFSNFMVDYQQKIRKDYELLCKSRIIEIEENPIEYSEFYFKCSTMISEFKAFFEAVLSK